MSNAMSPVAKRTEVSHNHESQLVLRALLNDLKKADIESSPSFTHQPEGNGCVKRLIHTLTQQQLWLHRFPKVAERHQPLHDFRHHFSNRWAIGWICYPAPASHGSIRLGHNA